VIFGAATTVGVVVLEATVALGALEATAAFAVLEVVFVFVLASDVVTVGATGMDCPANIPTVAPSEAISTRLVAYAPSNFFLDFTAVLEAIVITTYL
jgi:hypothetical protein